MNSIKVLIKITFALFFASNILAQESLTDLSFNEQIIEYYRQNPDFKRNLVYDTLELPFFDDFSQPEFFPQQDLWKDANVFINSSYAIEPISVGVATFDALNGLGYLYENLDAYPKFADYLTSAPINLDLANSAGVVLSFFVQAQGIGNAPEAGDSLILQFLSKSDGWVKVWGLAGRGVSSFKQYFVPVNENRFLYKGFQFRFANKVSLSGASNPSAAANCDHWHHDYLKMDKNRNINDTIINDVAFYAPSRPMLLKYASMPWSHYRVAASAEFNSIYFNFRNNDYLDRNVSTIYAYYDKKYNLSVDSGFVQVENVLPYTIVSNRFMLEENPFAPNFDDEAKFEIRLYLITDGFDYKPNNKVVTKQEFENFYAYDDGSAENGYGIESATGKLAYKFQSYIPDSLRAVDIFFNRTKANASQQYFFLTVWNDNNGSPGEVIYQKQGFRPEYDDGLNKFHRYFLDSAIAVNGFFYVGWTQTTDKNLNVGFDANLHAKNRIFYNTNGPWLQSVFSETGSLMIRAVIGKPLTTGFEVPKPQQKPIVYPNPCNDILHFTHLTGDSFYSIYNLTGQNISSGISNDQILNVSALPEGIYLLKIQNHGQSFSLKFSISR